MLEFYDLRDLWAMVKFHDFTEGTPIGVRWFDGKPSAVILTPQGRVMDVPVQEMILKEVRCRISFREKSQPDVDHDLPF